MKRPSQAKMQAECDRFNKLHPVGTSILCWPGTKDIAPVARMVSGPASILGGHTPVVYVSGGGGTIALSHVCRTTEARPAPMMADAEIPF